MLVFFQDSKYAASTASFLLELHPVSMFLKSRISTLVTSLMEVTLVFYLIGLHTSPLTVRFWAVIISISDSGGAQMRLNVFWNSTDASISRGTPPTFDAVSAGKRRPMPLVPWLSLCCVLSSFPKSAQENLWKHPRKCCSVFSTAYILTARLGFLFCKDRPLFMKRDFSFKHTY